MLYAKGKTPCDIVIDDMKLTNVMVGSKKAWGVKESIGQAVMLPDTTDNKFKELKIYGKTTQMHTKGINLANFVNSAPKTTNNVTVWGDKYGIVHCDGVSSISSGYVFTYFSDYIDTSKLTVGKTYTSLISDSSGASIRYYVDGVVKYGSFTYDGTQTNIQAYVRMTASDYVAGRIFKQMIYEVPDDNTTPAWEPYSECIASPSPEFTQPIDGVCPPIEKNLADNSVMENGSIQRMDGININTSNRVRTRYIYLDAGTYTITVYGGIKFTTIHTYNGTDSSTWVSAVYVEPTITDNTCYSTLTLSEACYIRFAIAPQDETIITDLSVSDFPNTYQVQIEYGEVSTDYEPYKPFICKTSILGENLFPQELSDTSNWIKNATDVTLTVSSDLSEITVSGTSAYAQAYQSSEYNVPVTGGKTYYFNYTVIGGNNPYISLQWYNSSNAQICASVLRSTNEVMAFKAPENTTSLRIAFVANNSSTALDEATTATFSNFYIKEMTPYGIVKIDGITELNRMEVSEGGNYIDGEGKQYICDYIDVIRMVRVQVLDKKIIDGSQVWDETIANANVRYTQFLTNKSASNRVLCDSYICDTSAAVNMVDKSVKLSSPTSSSYIYIHDTDYSTIEDFRSALNTNPIEVLYALPTPIETPLTDAEIAAVKTLIANKGYTKIETNTDADIEVKYITSGKTLIPSGYIKSNAKLFLDGLINTTEWHKNGSIIWNDLSNNGNDFYARYLTTTGKLSIEESSGGSNSLFGKDHLLGTGTEWKSMICKNKIMEGFRNCTIEVCCNISDDITDGAQYYWIFQNRQGADNNKLGFQFISSYKDTFGANLHLAILNSDNTISHFNQSTISAPELELGKLHTVSITIDIDNDRLAYYQDGVLIRESNSINTSQLLSYTYNQPMYIIGSAYPWASHPLKGKLHSVRIYNRALDETEIAQNWTADKNRFNIE